MKPIKYELIASGQNAPYSGHEILICTLQI